MAKQKQSKAEAAAAAMLAKKKPATAAKPEKVTAEQVKNQRGSLTDEQIIDRAKDWAHLHKNPKTRPDMDKLIAGLDEKSARRVVLCGQRIRAGMTPRIAA